MIGNLSNFLLKILAGIAAVWTAYRQGQRETENADLKHRNQKYKKALDATLNGDYSPDAVARRMRAAKWEN